MRNTLVLGIGNSLLSDEGAGIHALDYLASHYPDLPAVEYLDGGTLSFTLAEAVEAAANLIVIDAARLKEPAGTVRCLVGDEMDSFIGSAKRSVHEVGLADLVDIARLAGRYPENRALIGVQPQILGWGNTVSEPVARAMPRIAGHVARLVRAWAPAAPDCESLDLGQYPERA